MNRAFLELYENELRHIREHAAEFAAAYPKIAARLALDKDARDTCPDPFVERLLEGFAYLAARVQMKLEAEFPRFTQGILETVYPDYMAPWPSAAIARLQPKHDDKSLLGGALLPRGSAMSSLAVKDEATTCTFTTAHNVRLLPFSVAEDKSGAEYHTRNLGELNLGRYCSDARAALRLRIRLHGADDVTLDKVETDRLVLFVHGEDHLPSSILEAVFAHGRGVLITAAGDSRHKSATWLERGCLEHAGFSEDEAMLPRSPGSFEGHRILREHFMIPQRNHFFTVNGVRAALQKLAVREFDLIIPLSERHQNLEGFITGGLFQFNCTPVVNLFRKRLDRIPLGPGFTEYQAIPDRLRMLDFEVHTVLDVTGYGRTSTDQQAFHPFYLQPSHSSSPVGFYTVNRLPRTLSENERHFGPRSTYAGSEVFLSLVDPSAAPISPSLEQLAVTALCTNRHLPLTMPKGLGETDFILDDHAPVKSVRCLVGPTSPRPSFAEGRHAWRAISLLSLNYLSLVEDKTSSGVLALRELLRLYTSFNVSSQRMLDGLVSVSSRPSLSRSPGGGPVVFVRGMDVDLTLDEDRFAGSGVFTLASVLEQFIARYVTLNNYTRLKLNTVQRKEVMTWPPRLGRIPPL